jgi:predicted phage tail protein
VSNSAVFDPVLIPGSGGTPPAAPTNLTAAAVSITQINLTWTDNASNETGFKIERCKGSTCTNFSQIATVGANVTSYQNTGLSGNTTYRYRVRAYNAAGNSAYSNIAQATTPRR